MSIFNLKPIIYSGSDANKAFKDFPIRKALFIVDPFLLRNGLADIVIAEFLKQNISYEIFSQIEPDAPLHVITAGIHKLLNTRADCIVALGGGSCIDTAKSIIYFSKEALPQKPQFLAVPTTCGTGSEVTSFSIVKSGKTKLPLIDEFMLPDAAILHSRFIEKLPLNMVRETSIDALSHALEAYVSTEANEFSDLFAEKAVHLIFDNLSLVFVDETDMRAREKLLLASCLAGISFDSAKLGINHSLAHALGSHFGIPHGRANGYFLRQVINYNATHSACAADKYTSLMKLFGFHPKDSREGAEFLLAGLNVLFSAVDTSESLSVAGIAWKDYEDQLASMAEQALQDACTKTNPCQPAKSDLTQILKSIY